jgi:hypothetical protein
LRASQEFERTSLAKTSESSAGVLPLTGEDAPPVTAEDIEEARQSPAGMGRVAATAASSEPGTGEART